MASYRLRIVIAGKFAGDLGRSTGVGDRICHFTGRLGARIENNLEVAARLRGEEMDARATRPDRVVDGQRRSFYGRRTPASQGFQHPGALPRSQGNSRKRLKNYASNVYVDSGGTPER